MYLIKVYSFCLNFFSPQIGTYVRKYTGKYFDYIHFISCTISLNAADSYVQCINGRVVKPCRIEK